MKYSPLSYLSLLCLLTTSLSAQLTISGNPTSVSLGDNARITSTTINVTNGAAVLLNGNDNRLEGGELVISTDGQLLITGTNNLVELDNSISIQAGALLNASGQNAFLASELITVHDDGSLRMTGSDASLFSFTNFIIEDGGQFINRAYVEAVEVNWNGEVIFLLADDSSTNDYGRVYSENEPIIVNGSIEGRLLNGYVPTTAQSYRLIELDGNFDQAGFTEIIPGPGWVFDTEQNYVDLNFDPSILPVEWLTFRGQWQDEAVRLNWQTASESGSSYFGVERQNRLGEWEQIGTVAAAGNSSITSTYTFLDLSPGLAEEIYYRLRQVDLDGSFSYSSIVNLHRSNEQYATSIYPNPANRHVYATGFGEGEYFITNSTGQRVSSGFIPYGSAPFRIELPQSLTVGTYFLRGANGEGLSFNVVR